MSIRDFWDDHWIYLMIAGIVGAMSFVYYRATREPEGVDPTTQQEQVLQQRDMNIATLESVLSRIIEDGAQDGMDSDSILVPLDSLIKMKTCLDTLINDVQTLDSLREVLVKKSYKDGYIDHSNSHFPDI